MLVIINNEIYFFFFFFTTDSEPIGGGCSWKSETYKQGERFDLWMAVKIVSVTQETSVARQGKVSEGNYAIAGNYAIPCKNGCRRQAQKEVTQKRKKKGDQMYEERKIKLEDDG